MAFRIIIQHPGMDRTICAKGFSRRGLVALALKTPAAASEPMLCAVLVKYTETAAFAVNAKGKRVGRAPSARVFVEPSEEHSAAAFGLGHSEFARGGEA